MVARGWDMQAVDREASVSGEPRRATIKAHPSPHHPPSPLRMLVSFSLS